MGELEQEKALVAEIENSDQMYLSELKTTISEQKSVFLFQSQSWSDKHWPNVVPSSKLSAQTSQKAMRNLNA
jgi:hypothetical protein